MEPKQIHPVVRISYEDNDPGTGVIVASKENRDEDFETYILTRYEWIEEAIEIEERFDSMIGEERKMETRSQVDVEIPTYKERLNIAGTRTLKGDITSYDEEIDLAIVKLDDIAEYQKIAPISDVGSKSADKVRVAGIVPRYSLPFHKKGEIIGKGIREGDQVYDLVRASKSLFVAGGVVLDEEEGTVKGILSGKDVKIAEGKGSFSTKFMISLERIKEWLEDEFLKFLFDDTVDMSEQKEKREKYKEKETHRRIAQAGLSEKP